MIGCLHRMIGDDCDYFMCVSIASCSVERRLQRVTISRFGVSSSCRWRSPCRHVGTDIQSHGASTVQHERGEESAKNQHGGGGGGYFSVCEPSWRTEQTPPLYNIQVYRSTARDFYSEIMLDYSPVSFFSSLA